MKTVRWSRVVAMLLCCLAVGASGVDAKPPSTETVPEGKPQRKPGPVRVVVSKININEASKTDLMQLNGVTAGVAQRIIAYREAHGRFKRTQDLRKVDGVSRDVIEKNPGRITVK
jgi:competence ComEA-like helix-hairpin-helix protein